MRLLSARGEASLVTGVLHNADRVKDFLGKLKDPTKDPLLVYGLVYILRPELLDFVLGPLTQLVHEAANETRCTTETRRGAIRGHIMWPRTLVARAAGRIDRGTFEVLTRVRSQDIPENQLIKLFLVSLSKLARTLSQEVSSGAIYRQLVILKGRVDRLLRGGWVQDISDCPRLTAVMQKRAKRSKDVRYSHLSRFQREYEAAFDRPVWTYILTLIQQAWLEPIADDDLFELFSLIKIVDILQQDLGFSPPTEFGLIKRKRTEIASLRRAGDSCLVQLYFDQSPTSVFGCASSYMHLDQEYLDFHGQPRRPDILLRFVCSHNRERRLILECKDTGDDGYRRDSVYKALAYLRDFETLWDAADAQQPKVIVLLPALIRRKTQNVQDVALVSPDDREEMRYLLRAALTVS